MFEVEARGHEIQLDAKIRDESPVSEARMARDRASAGESVRNATQVHAERRPDLDRRRTSQAGTVEFSVQDSGPGIPLENQARLFDRYWQSSNGARARHGGWGFPSRKASTTRTAERSGFEAIRVTGSTFHFAIPAASAPVRRA
jgi:K+-sensing histidine kinase KdpD